MTSAVIPADSASTLYTQPSQRPIAAEAFARRKLREVDGSVESVIDHHHQDRHPADAVQFRHVRPKQQCFAIASKAERYIRRNETILAARAASIFAYANLKAQG